MAYIRLVHPREFDHEKGRFSDLAFKNSSDGGMSVFEQACAESASGGVICVHAKSYYASITGEPPVFYIIGELELPESATLKKTLSDTGDECHREVENASNNKLYKAFKSRRSPELFLRAKTMLSGL